jgi:hypothetical protein
VPLHKDTAHYLSFHFALPEFVRRPGGLLEPVPLQPGGCWVTADDGSRFQVIECSCAALPFGYTNSQFLWTKVIKTLAKAMPRAGIWCLWYIDDACCALPSRAEALSARDQIEQMFAGSGLAKAPDKGVSQSESIISTTSELYTAPVCWGLHTKVDI